MRSLTPQIATGASAFAATLLFFAPASLVAGVLSQQAPQFEFERVTGTLWRGAFEGAQIEGYRLGDVAFEFTPLSLLAGSLGYRVQGPASGALQFSGRIAVSPISKSLRIADADARFDLNSITRYTLFGAPYQGDLKVRIDRLHLSQSACDIAEGHVETDVLDATAKRYFQQPLLLTGVFTCSGDRLQLDLAGDNALGHVEIVTSITPALSYEVLASVRAQRPEVLASLRRVGFRNSGDAMKYEAVGALKGLGS